MKNNSGPGFQLPVMAIGFRFEQTRFPSEIRKPAFEYPNNQRVPLIPSDCQVIGALLSTKKPWVSLAHQIEQSSVPQRIHSVTIFKITPPSKESTSMIQSTEFNGSSQTLVLISWGSFSRFIDAISKHLKPYQHFSRAQAEHAGLSSSIVPDELAISAWPVCWDRLLDAGRAASSSELSYQTDALPKPIATNSIKYHQTIQKIDGVHQINAQTLLEST